jgi:hypothetical protein
MQTRIVSGICGKKIAAERRNGSSFQRSIRFNKQKDAFFPKDALQPAKKYNRGFTYGVYRLTR